MPYVVETLSSTLYEMRGAVGSGYGVSLVVIPGVMVACVALSDVVPSVVPF